MISVGASGGIFGLIGACLADIFMNWGLLFNQFVNGKNKHRHIYILLALLVDVIINCLIGLTPFVDNFTREFDIGSRDRHTSFHQNMFHFYLTRFILVQI
jgi:membrane associated rhomboid family serine protease